MGVALNAQAVAYFERQGASVVVNSDQNSHDLDKCLDYVRRKQEASKHKVRLRWVAATPLPRSSFQSARGPPLAMRDRWGAVSRVCVRRFWWAR